MIWMLWLVGTTIVIISAISIMLSLKYYQTAQAFPCVGHPQKEYCEGYRDGAIQAKKDFENSQDLDIDQHSCIRNITLYCNGYNRGYNDEADFLG
ncbi:MAG TPA: hypothetical protein VJ729_02685 [Nitrososphaeraceae archaeon]|nr:hypothetical protein [Nitrososphaeraceae archaeon]